MNKKTIIGISGGGRENSYNTRLLISMQQMLPLQANIVVPEAMHTIPLPFYESGNTRIPEQIRELQQEIKKADGVIFSTPQFNYNIPVALKVIIQWVTKDGADNVFDAKPAAMIGASVDTMGTQRAQAHLLDSLQKMHMRIFEWPLINITSVDGKFDPAGGLSDPELRELLKKFLTAFVDFI
jgi:chromate reductase